MIRKYKESDLEGVIKIWLDASIKAHDFVDSSFWKDRADDMRNNYIPNSETWVYQDDNEVVAFFSLVENTLAAIFVKPGLQGKGIGQLLMAEAKSLRKSLSLTVYADNARSVEFYRRQGFDVKEERTDPHTGHKEVVMVFNS